MCCVCRLVSESEQASVQSGEEKDEPLDRYGYRESKKPKYRKSALDTTGQVFGLSMLCKTEGGGSDGKEDTVSVAERSLGVTRRR